MTLKFGLIGKSLSHSFSKTFFTGKFKAEKIDAQYDNYELKSASEMRQLFEVDPNLMGLNVTVPFKVEVLPFLDEIDTVARSIGAVNTIKKQKDGAIKGYNTDYLGFQKDFSAFIGKAEGTALVLGKGGAAKAVSAALDLLCIAHRFVTRNPLDSGDLSYAELTKDIVQYARFIINTTPLGTFPEVDSAPDIPYRYLSGNHFLNDLVYNPSETKFLKLGAEMGAATRNGYQMLVFQAEEAWKIWQKG